MGRREPNFLVTWIAIEKHIEFEEVPALLAAMFPDRRITDQEALYEDKSDKFWMDLTDIIFSLDRARGEFESYLSLTFYFLPDSNYQVVNVFVAYNLSRMLNCRVYCDGEGYGSDPSPYWGLIFDRGNCYLADDCNTDLIDGEGGPVRIVKPLQVEIPRLEDLEQFP